MKQASGDETSPLKSSKQNLCRDAADDIHRRKLPITILF